MNTPVRLSELCEIVKARGLSRRSITAIAGPPGAGKSTLAETLVDMLNAEDPESAAVFPMDGYHFDDAVLNARGWRARKGAPHTFDVAGFAQMLARLRRNEEDEIAVPVFDRDIEISRNSARIIPGSVRHLIVEGNYLLLDEPPWTNLAGSFDTSVFIDVPIVVLTQRLGDRWKDLSVQERVSKLEENDLPNARLVQTRRSPAEFILSSPEEAGPT